MKQLIETILGNNKDEYLWDTQRAAVEDWISTYTHSGPLNRFGPLNIEIPLKPKIKNGKALFQVVAPTYIYYASSAESLTNGMFEWVSSPKHPPTIFIEDTKITNLQGCPKKVNSISVRYNKKLKDLIGAPTFVENMFHITYNPKLKNLMGLEKTQIQRLLQIRGNDGMESLYPGIKYIGENCYIFDCPNLRELNMKNSKFFVEIDCKDCPNLKFTPEEYSQFKIKNSHE